MSKVGEEYLNEPLSNMDLNKAILQFDHKGAQIFQDEDITQNTPIEKIFKNRGHCIMFHKYKGSGVGHWYCLTRDKKKNVVIFDSYGRDPGFYCKNMIPCLKNNGIKNVIINKKKYQHNESAVCGRYGLALCVYNKLGMNIEQIQKALEDGKKKYGSYDKYILSIST